MNIAVSMWSLVREAQAGQMDVPAFVRYVKEIDADGVELLDVFWHNRDGELPGVLVALRETGLPVSAYAIGNDLVQPDPDARAHAVQAIHDGVATAWRLGATMLRVFSGGEKDGVRPEQGYEWIVEGLRDGAAYAAAHGVTLALENHGLFAGRADQVHRIIADVSSPALRATIDTGNFLLVNQDPVAAARSLAPLAAYVHLKDFRLVGAGEQVEHAYTGLGGVRCAGTTIGAGDVDLPGVIAALRAGGYDGWLSIEYEGTGDAREEVAASLRATRELLRAGT